MAYKLAAPIAKTVKLLSLDKSGATVATFRQATMAQVEARTALFQDVEYVIPDEAGNSVIQRSRYNAAAVGREEVFLTMTDCNIIGQDDLPLFPYRNGVIDRATFTAAWNQLTKDVADALVDACYEVNLQWGGPRPKAEKTEPEQQDSAPAPEASPGA